MRRNPLIRIERALLQSRTGEHIHRIAIRLAALWLHHAQHLASPLCDDHRLRIGCPHQRRRHRGLPRVESMRRFAEQRARQRIDADDLAAKRHCVEVRLQHLVFAPAAFQLRGRYRLPDFLREASPTTRAPQVVVEQAGQLHGDGRGAARFRVPQIAPRGRRCRTPVDAAVFVETLVFAQHHGGTQGRRDIVERDPLPATHRRVDAHALQQFAMAIEHGDIGRAKAALDCIEGRDCCRYAGIRDQQHHGSQRFAGTAWYGDERAAGHRGRGTDEPEASRQGRRRKTKLQLRPVSRWPVPDVGVNFAATG